ncbi:hypothetical protein VOLCADRAFT_79757 [Volvox carteri f. nagariensis]|uniref:Complex 1 LYR protein domain-containing protein n=1 Tax=Volvox carteri f. nagariensis TaxID=3068 RepID=D8TMB9_VOLCA|nr:uncharacterized protein VOLCADRAFT_79757 [Volvox carteri f. nagariensis]EFJ51616.1 hypothetical protein VOLCADRAFT_79757 [Volvox carteri f. nagariensis]|eukprot:XP_002947568.1 hypothetical protein VOLCADRAFT_79757 [Volvox carteri f. nagariensis]
MTDRRFTGLQRQVLGLYRACLRSIRAKPEEARPSLFAFARSEFERNRNISPRDIQRIEHLLRHGRKLMELLKASEAKGVIFRSG